MSIIVLGSTFHPGDAHNGGLRGDYTENWHKIFYSIKDLEKWLDTNPNGSFRAYHIGEEVKINPIMKPQPDIQVGYKLEK